MIMDIKDAHKVIENLQTRPYICSENTIELDNDYVIVKKAYFKECREARERQRGKKPEFELNLSDYTSRFVCECGRRVIVKHDSGVMDNHDAPNYCSNCGQRFDWSDTD